MVAGRRRPMRSLPPSARQGSQPSASGVATHRAGQARYSERRSSFGASVSRTRAHTTATRSQPTSSRHRADERPACARPSQRERRDLLCSFGDALGRPTDRGGGHRGDAPDHRRSPRRTPTGADCRALARRTAHPGSALTGQARPRRAAVLRAAIQRQLGHANLGTTSIYLEGIDTEEIIGHSAGPTGADDVRHENSNPAAGWRVHLTPGPLAMGRPGVCWSAEGGAVRRGLAVVE